MERRPDDHAVWLLLTVPAGIALLLAVFLIPWPPFHEWAGTKPPVEVFALIVTPLGAIAALAGVLINADANRKSLGEARRAQRASTFQRGAEMLAIGSASSKIAGIQILRELAFEDPDTYFPPVSDTLEYFVEERSAGDFDERVERVTNGEWVEVDTVAAHAADRLCQVLLNYAQMEQLDRGEKLSTINTFALTHWETTSFRLCHVQVVRMLMHSAKAIDATLSGLEAGFQIGSEVKFIACDMTASRLTVTRLDGEPLVPSDTDVLEFIDCVRVSGATINDRPLSEWIEESQRLGER